MTKRIVTINQINSFCDRNPVLAHYLKWKEDVNRRDRRWNEYATGKLEKRQIQRVTLRGNAIYGNLLRSIGAFMGVADLNNYNYHRDHLYFDLSVRYIVSLDVDGVWVKAELPWDKPNEWGYPQRVFLHERLRAAVPFDKAALVGAIKRLDSKLFFPDTTVLGKIQRQYRKDKKQAMQFLASLMKEAKLARGHNFVPEDENDRYESREVQRAIARRLSKVYNIDAGMITVNKKLFAELVGRGRQEKRKRLDRLDFSDLMTNFDRDIDELEAEYYSRFEEDCIYV
jgi:hypothetical protein